MLRFRRLALTCAPLACVLLIGAALLPREAQPASDIDDLKTGVFFYQGELFSNTSGAIEGNNLRFDVNSKSGKNFSGSVPLGGTITGSVSTSGKFKAEIVSGVSKTGRGIGPAGGFTSIKLKGQLSATGEAVIGTYSTQGLVDKGTFYMLAIAEF